MSIQNKSSMNNSLNKFNFDVCKVDSLRPVKPTSKTLFCFILFISIIYFFKLTNNMKI